MPSLSILWHSNAPWAASGYGKITRYICPLLQKLGHKVTISAFFGLQGGVLEMNDMEVLPGGLQAWGNDIIEAHSRRSKADMVVAVIDPWVLREFGHRLPGKFYPYFPIDGAPVAPQMIRSIEGCTGVLVYSKFAKEELEKVGFQDAVYIPLGYDPQVFHPLSDTAKESKLAGKRELGMDPEFLLFSMIAANQTYPTRKCFEQHIEAFQMFHEKYPKSLLYIHADPLPTRGGINIPEVAQLLGADTNAIKFPNRYEYQLGLAETEINKLLNATDLYLGASAGEGFGMPLVEAQAVGTPVITTKATSTEELCGSGWLIPPSDKRYYLLGTFHFPPDIKMIYQAMEEFVESDREQLFRDALEFTKNLTWGRIIEDYWKPFLNPIEKKVFGTPISKYPKVGVLTVIGPDIGPLPSFFGFLNDLDYPKENIICRFVVHPKAVEEFGRLVGTLNKPYLIYDGLYPNDYKSRREEIYSISNFLLDHLEDEQYVLLADSDLCRSYPGLLKNLIAHNVDIVAPLVVLDNSGDWYYDMWAFRKNGRMFGHRFPYFLGMKSGGNLEELDSVGSIYLMKRKVADMARFHWETTVNLEHGHVGFCKEVRSKGRKVFCDTAQIVYHSCLERYHQETDWEAPPDSGGELK